MPMLSILSMVVGLVMLRATIFRLLYVQRRIAPRGSSGLGVWSDLLSMMTILAMGSNTVFAALLIRDSGIISCPSSPLPAPPSSCGEWSTSTLILGVLLLLVVLRLAINALTPENPVWLQLLLARGRHFEQHGRTYDPALLSAAMSTERAERRRNERYGAAARISAALRSALWSLPVCVVKAYAEIRRRKAADPPRQPSREYSLLAEESVLVSRLSRERKIRSEASGTARQPSHEYNLLVEESVLVSRLSRERNMRSEASGTAPPSDSGPPPEIVDPFFMPAAFLGPLVRRFGVVIGIITVVLELL